MNPGNLPAMLMMAAIAAAHAVDAVAQTPPDAAATHAQAAPAAAPMSDG
jgi:hypothetical protein